MGIDVSNGRAKNLSILYLKDKKFVGTTPAEIGQIRWSKFQENSNKLNGMGANSFRGTIPTSVGNCTELVQSIGPF